MIDCDHSPANGREDLGRRSYGLDGADVVAADQVRSFLRQFNERDVSKIVRGMTRNTDDGFFSVDRDPFVRFRIVFFEFVVIVNTMNSFEKGVPIIRLEKLSTKVYIVKLFFQKKPFFFPISSDRRVIQVFVEAVAPVSSGQAAS